MYVLYFRVLAVFLLFSSASAFAILATSRKTACNQMSSNRANTNGSPVKPFSLRHFPRTVPIKGHRDASCAHPDDILCGMRAETSTGDTCRISCRLASAEHNPRCRQCCFSNMCLNGSSCIGPGSWIVADSVAVCSPLSDHPFRTTVQGMMIEHNTSYTL